MVVAVCIAPSLRNIKKEKSHYISYCPSQLSNGLISLVFNPPSIYLFHTLTFAKLVKRDSILAFCSCVAEQDCVHSDAKLWLIFEWVDQDLKRYMNSCKSKLEPMLIKVGVVWRLNK